MRDGLSFDQKIVSEIVNRRLDAPWWRRPWRRPRETELHHFSRVVGMVLGDLLYERALHRAKEIRREHGRSTTA